ncbi:MAG: four helix bundle protein [Mangrovibacterium sp.]
MQYQYQFKKLDVWKLSIELTKTIYQLTQHFPDYEKFGLSNQIRRASVSISSNIAEGSGCISPKNQARYYEIAFGSLMEVTSQLFLAKELGYVSEDIFNIVRPSINPIAVKLSTLRSSARKRASNLKPH